MSMIFLAQSWRIGHLHEVEAVGVEADLALEPPHPILEAAPHIVVGVVKVC